MKNTNATTFKTTVHSTEKRINKLRSLLSEGCGRQVALLAQWFAIILFTSGSASAETEGATCPAPPDAFVPIIRLLSRLQDAAIAIALSVAVLALLYAGGMMMVGRYQRARRVVFNTGIGLVVVLLASALVSFIKQVLGCGGI